MAPLLLVLVAFGARLLTAAVVADPAYPDSFYYVNVARELAAGQGLSVDYIWNFVEVGGRLPEVGVLPIPSNAHWMPLAVVIQIPFIGLLGPTALASGLPFWLCSAAVAPVTYAIARDAGMQRWQAVAGGLLAAIPGALTPYLSQPDNFGPFMLLGALSLWACARGLRGDRRSFALGGVAVGLAFLSRNDGVLLGVPFALAFLAEAVRRPARPRIGWRAALLCGALFLLVVSPWLLRQLAVFGSLSPSAANGRILWLTDYRQLWSVASEATPASFLASGFDQVLGSRAGGLAWALIIFTTVPLLLLMAPVTLLGAWVRRRDPAFVPWIVYGITLLAFSGLLFAVHVRYGTFLHSAVALVPHAYLAGLIGIATAIDAVARRRAGWDPPRATRAFSVMAIAVVITGGLAGTVMTLRSWRDDMDTRGPIVAALVEVPAGDRVMGPDPGALRYLAGRRGVVTPDDPLPVVEQALRLYGVRWLVLERDHSVPSLAPVLAGDERPGWLSEPVAQVDGSRDPGSARGDLDGPAVPRAALYAVCLDASDRRCDR